MNPQGFAPNWQGQPWAGGSERIVDGRIGLISKTRAPRSISYTTTPMSTYNQSKMDIWFERDYTGTGKDLTLTLFLSDADHPDLATWINSNWTNINIDNQIDTQIKPTEDLKEDLRIDVYQAMEHHFKKCKESRERQDIFRYN